jgi:hypothetical protein
MVIKSGYKTFIHVDHGYEIFIHVDRGYEIFIHVVMKGQGWRLKLSKWVMILQEEFM